jgi:hypothetical protein
MPFISNFYPNYIVSFYREPAKLTTKFPETVQPEVNKVKGTLSRKSSLRLAKCLTWLWLFSKRQYGYGKDINKKFMFKVNFFTTTLSDAQMHSDDWIKIHMLSPLLKWMERQGCKHYIWKAETQENGNIHFHITTNHFIHYRKFRDKWNSIQYKHGYLKRREESGSDLDPNSTDVHAVKKEGQFVKYMTAYMRKDIQERESVNPTSQMTFISGSIERELAYASIATAGISGIRRQVEGKIWACNRELLDIKVQITSQQEDYGDVMQDHVDRFNAQWQKHDFCDTYRHKMISMNDKLHPELAARFKLAYIKFHAKG